MDSGLVAASRRRLEDIDKKFTSQSGLDNETEIETTRGSIRIHHLTCSALQSNGAQEDSPRFPRLEECAHFHYENVELSSFAAEIYIEKSNSAVVPFIPNGAVSEKFWIIQVASRSKTWLVRRTFGNFCSLDLQLHRCIYDRNFSQLKELDSNFEHSSEDLLRPLLAEYLNRLSEINGPLLNCAPVLNWFELDNRGHRLIATDDSDINTPAVAAAYAIRRYQALAADEISFEIGDMISVIDMPPPEESAWWRGKRGFDVGFFPYECVQVIGEKVPRGLQFPPPAPLADCPSTFRRDSFQLPNKPVLRKHGKLISFFRSFILSRPARRKLKQSGILKERVFGCDLGEHLLNSAHDIPLVLRVCADYIESHGIVDGIYRLSGVSSNIQKLRVAFDEDKTPVFQSDEQIVLDIHAVSSLLKMYFRELPNPLCTYQLYDKFVEAVQQEDDESRLLCMRSVVMQLPPPHYRTLEYLMRHLFHVAENSSLTGMTAKNLAIVWAPNLLRCKDLEAGGVAALQGVGIQAVVTEYLVRYVNVIFSSDLLIENDLIESDPKRLRPKSLAISTPGKLLSLEEARNRAQLAAGKTDQKFIEVGGGPATLPKYHTVIQLPNKRNSSIKQKKSPSGWKSFFSKSRGQSSSATREEPSSSAKGHSRTLSSVSAGPVVHISRKDQVTTPITRQGSLPRRRKLGPVKSAESLKVSCSTCSSRNSECIENPAVTSPQAGDLILASVVTQEDDSQPVEIRTHNRSASHDSYFNILFEPGEINHQPLNEVDESFVLSDMQLDSTLNLDNSDMNMMCSEEMMRDKSQEESCVASDPKRTKVEKEIISAHVASAVNRAVSVTGLQCAFNPVYEISDKKSGDSTPENTEFQVGDIISETVDRSDSLDNISVHETTEQETGVPISECSISLPVTVDQSLALQTRPQIAVNIDYENILSSVDISVPYESVADSAPPSYNAVIHDEFYENILYSSQESSGPYDTSGYELIKKENEENENYEPLVKEEVRYEVLQREDETSYEQLLDNRPYECLTSTEERPYETFGTELSDTYENVQSTYENINHSANQLEYENVGTEPNLTYENLPPEPAPRNSVPKDVPYENCNGNAPEDKVEDSGISYENILKESELKAIIKSSVTDNNLYEDISVSDLHLMPSPPSTIESEEVVYQQVKVLKRSIEEVNEIIREPSTEKSTIKDASSIIQKIKTPSKICATESPKSAVSEPIEPVKTPQDNKSLDRSTSVTVEFPIPWRAKKSKTDVKPKVVSQVSNHPSQCSTPKTKEIPDRPKKLDLSKFETAVIKGTTVTPSKINMKSPTLASAISETEQKLPTPKCTEEKSCGLVHSTSSLEKVHGRMSLIESPVTPKRPSLSLVLEPPTSESRNRCRTESELNTHTSPARRLSFLETDESKRRVESEIGRDLIHARKFRDEIVTRRHEVPPATESKENINPKIDARLVDGIVCARPALITPVTRYERKTDKKASVKDLLNQFEGGKEVEDLDNKTKSLEGGISLIQGTATNDEIVRPKSAPNDESHLLNSDNLSLTELNDRLIDAKVLVDMNDPNTRQRIEKYKEERRSQLREKFKSESFRGEKDDMLIRLKQKAGSPTRIECLSPLSTELELSRNNRSMRRNSTKSDLQSFKSDLKLDTKNDSISERINRLGTPPRVESELIGDDINVKELVANWTKEKESEIMKQEDKKAHLKKEEVKLRSIVISPTGRLQSGRDIIRDVDKNRIKNMAAIFEKEKLLATTSK
ncbi:GTPase-activating protein CdGAPr-like isoform X3 [Artemia franciscana]